MQGGGGESFLPPHTPLLHLTFLLEWPLVNSNSVIMYYFSTKRTLYKHVNTLGSVIQITTESDCRLSHLSQTKVFTFSDTCMVLCTTDISFIYVC